jgi:tetratricopeptide (TPR) repeat protein
LALLDIEMMPGDTAPNIPSDPAELIQQGRYRDAIAVLDEQLLSKPADVDLLRRKASALLSVGETDLALATYDEILGAEPRNVEILIEKADLLVWLSRHEDALALYHSAIEADPSNAVIYQKKGLTLRLLQRLDAALESYEQALKIDSHDPRSWWGQGDVWLDKDQLADAFRCYSEGELVDSAKLYGASAWTDRGDQLFDRGQPEPAQFCYRKSIEKDPNYLWGWRGMGLSLNVLGENEEALKFVERALELESKGDSRLATVWAEKGNVLFDLKRFPQASDCYHKALEIDPQNIVALINLGVIRQDEGKYEEAIRFYEQALQIDDLRAELWQNKGYCRGMLGEFDDGIHCYDKVLELAEDSIWAWNNKGYLLTKIGKRDESILCFDKAIAIDKSQILPWTNKAITLRELKRYPAAEECLRNALEIATDEDDKIELLMQLGSILGDHTWDHEGALQVYQRALEIRSTADVQANIAECLIKLGKYNEGRQVALSTKSDEKSLACILSYLVVVSYALECDGEKFDRSFKDFLKHFENPRDGELIRLTPEEWDYRGLLNIIANKSPDTRTRFLLSLSVDLQIGALDPSKLAFFSLSAVPSETNPLPLHAAP